MTNAPKVRLKRTTAFAKLGCCQSSISPLKIVFRHTYKIKNPCERLVKHRTHMYIDHSILSSSPAQAVTNRGFRQPASTLWVPLCKQNLSEFHGSNIVPVLTCGVLG